MVSPEKYNKTIISYKINAIFLLFHLKIPIVVLALTLLWMYIVSSEAKSLKLQSKVISIDSGLKFNWDPYKSLAMLLFDLIFFCNCFLLFSSILRLFLYSY